MMDNDRCGDEVAGNNQEENPSRKWHFSNFKSDIFCMKAFSEIYLLKVRVCVFL